ncbi:MAG: sodium-dependent transporter, partial [Anaerovoracaceae bacterium]
MEQEKKGQWGSNFGFLMAAVGSAVGLGNLWGFPYKMGNNGGFAFLLLYLLLVVFVGFIIMMAELSLGRKSRKGVVGAYESLGKKYKFVGWMGVAAPFLIMSFYTMLGGYCIKYAVANFGDMFGASWGVNGAASDTFFSNFYGDQFQSVLYTLIFIVLTILIVRAGVSSGIEKFTKIAMPALFIMLVIIIARSVTMPGAGAGLEFMFKPNFEVFKGLGWVTVLATAGGQMFFSLSLGMGAMITYGSYLSKKESLERNSFIIPIADTTIAIMAGLAVMPAVFASGLDPAGGPGLLFVTLQSVFASMGAAGPFFGFLLYVLVFIAAITSSISLLETVSAVVTDKREDQGKATNRNAVVIIIGLLMAVEAVFVSIDGLGTNGLPQILGQGCWLDTFDLVSEGILMPLGALFMAIIFGWIKPGYLNEEIRSSEGDFRTQKFFQFCIKWVVPPIMLLILVGQIDTFFKLG